MCMKTEITGVKRIECNGVTAALIECDKTAALERIFFAHNNANHDGSVAGFTLHSEQGSTRILWGVDEVIGLVCGCWQIFVSSDHEGVVVAKTDYYWDEELEDVDLEFEWIDVLMIVRNFFALDRAVEPDYEKWL